MKAFRKNEYIAINLFLGVHHNSVMGKLKKKLLFLRILNEIVTICRLIEVYHSRPKSLSLLP